MAYVTHLKPDGTYQPLKAHEENVAALAGKFAEAFGAKAHGERTGLLHDIGKYSDNGQKRQRDPEHTAKVDHAHGGNAAGMETERLCCGVCRGGPSRRFAGYGQRV